MTLKHNELEFLHHGTRQTGKNALSKANRGSNVLPWNHPARVTQSGVFLLSTKAGLRAKEIASLTWSMVVDAPSELGSGINLTNDASKGSKGGRFIPKNKELRSTLLQWFGLDPLTQKR